MTETTASTAETEAPPAGIWAAVKEAIRGTHQDYTTGSIGRAIFLLAVPMVLETAAESVFALVDVFWVSRLGSSAITTVGLTESMLTIIFTVAIGLSIGVTALVARRIGEKDPEGAADTAAQAVALGLIVAGVIGVFGAIFAPQLLRVMGADAAVIEMGTGYTRVMLGGNATVLLLFLINAVYRGAGDAAIAMRVLWVANGINLVLDPLFIFGIGPFPELGVQGAAVATNIGRGFAVLFQLSLLMRGAGRVKLFRRHLKIKPALMWHLIRLSGTATFQMFIGMASWVGLIRILSGFGTEVVAGYTVGIRLIIFALLPSWGMSNAAATMVGQSLGAGKPDRAEKAVWMAGFYNMVFLGIVGLFFFIFAPQIVSAFVSDPEPTRWGINCLRIVSTGFLFYAYGMVLTQSFNGAGDTWTPTKINLVCFWAIELPMAYLLAHQFGFGPNGVFVTMTVAFSLLAVISGIIFRRGTWKTKQV